VLQDLLLIIVILVTENKKLFTVCGIAVCKFFVTELKSRLAESAKSKEVIETGHGIDKPKRFKYLTSYVCFFVFF